MNNREAFEEAYIKFCKSHDCNWSARDLFYGGYKAALASQAQKPDYGLNELAQIIMSDCGISTTNNDQLYDRILARLIASSELQSQAQQPEKLDRLKLREFLECMQQGEMTVSRGLELIDLWMHGKYSNDMLPDYSNQPACIEQLANAMQMHADMTSKYIALSKSQAQQEAIGEVQHYAAPANLPAYVNVNWHGKPPKNGAKVYFLNPKD